MSLIHCSPAAYARCPYAKYCGPFEEAVYAGEDTECGEFNRRIAAQPQTNLDKIRALPLWDLADFLADVVDCGSCPAFPGRSCQDSDCRKHMLAFLQLPPTAG